MHFCTSLRNLSVGPKEAETFCRHYSRRWQIENEYKSIKNDFLAKRLPRIIAYGCSTSCSRCYCTISGGLPISC